MPVRAARFAGSWYPGEPDVLRRLVREKLPAGVVARPAKAVIAPHAGYVYSLAIAAEAYAQVVVPRTVVVLCPNHTVPPPIVSLWPSGRWETPLGPVPVDEALADRIRAECDVVAETGAHAREHAIELHLPILQTLQPDLRMVGLVVAEPQYEALERLGQGLARAIGQREDVLLVASTDMTHQESAESARAKDQRALAHLLKLDARGLLEVCVRDHISMCGVRPTAAVIVAAKELGATSAELIRYGNSGEVSGDYDHVVGYAGAVIR